MDGCLRRDRRASALAVAAGWHAENFRRAGKGLRDLDHYLSQLEPERPQTADEAAAVWKGFADRGLVTIREVPKDR
jgi:hypothetical protein